MTVSLRRHLALAGLPLALAACGGVGDSPVAVDTGSPGVASTSVGRARGSAPLDSVAAERAGPGVASPFVLVFDVAGLAIGPHRVFARVVEAPGGRADFKDLDRPRPPPGDLRSTDNERRESP